MALLGFKSRTDPIDTYLLRRLPSGSFTVDPAGRIVASTLPRSYPSEQVQEIARLAMTTFEEARDSHLLLTELVVDYPSLKMTARELRGGAIVFLAPRNLGQR
jgi:hypothetical protein